MKKIIFLLICMMLAVFSAVSADMNVGDEIICGSYEQDNDEDNGPEPIEWRVLAVEDGRALLISKYGLRSRWYNSEKKDGVTWANSSLRSWLNNDFFEEAFNEEEQAGILITTVVTDGDPETGTIGGDDTQDRLFVLSIEEAKAFFVSDKDRMGEATPYAKAHSAFVRSSTGMSEWWLRDPGKSNMYAAYVNGGGTITPAGNSLNNVSTTVRPVFWLDLTDGNETPAANEPAEKIVFSGFMDFYVTGETEATPEIISLEEAEEMGLSIPVPADGENLYLGEGKTAQAERMLAVFTADPEFSEVRNLNLLIYKANFETDSIKANNLTASVKADNAYPLTDGTIETESFKFSNFSRTDWGATAVLTFTLHLPQASGFEFTFDDAEMIFVRQGDEPDQAAAASDKSGNEKAFPEVGERIEFGHYEQDAVMKNGPEPIGWLVLAVEDDRALVVSEYGLDARSFHARNESVTWEDSTIRAWLNGEFLNEAFSADEQKQIMTIDDTVFLLSIQEAREYFASNQERMCFPTNYAINNGAYIHEETNGSVWWWLRNPDRQNAACVRHEGDVSSSGNGIIFKEAIRPAVWLDLTAYMNAAESSSPAEVPAAEPGPEPVIEIPDDLEIGDVFVFGRFEQDDLSDNGAEPIEWQVLAVEDGRALVLSSLILDAKPYHLEAGTVTWDTSDLRYWLNTDFMDTAFSKAERDYIAEVTIENPDNPMYETAGGGDTLDSLFLLSIPEAETLLETDEQRQGTASDHAKANGIFVDENSGKSWWWLRTPGSSDSDAAVVGVAGWILERGNFTDNEFIGVRPAMWINL